MQGTFIKWNRFDKLNEKVEIAIAYQNKDIVQQIFLFQIFSDWRVCGEPPCRRRNIPHYGECKSFVWSKFYHHKFSWPPCSWYHRQTNWRGRGNSWYVWVSIFSHGQIGKATLPSGTSLDFSIFHSKCFLIFKLFWSYYFTP